ncbi:hypothetical protein V9T40_008881 [Parthenolecanium corni]|uniref:Uncharacterized protein n=1 Tax=Parthenolecanium corni TaxID=536013 RepID=A0AAN9TLP8_9HEMI
MIRDPFPDDGIEPFPIFPSYVTKDWKNNKLKCDRPCCRKMYWGNISAHEKDESARSDAQSTISKSSRSSHESKSGKSSGTTHNREKYKHAVAKKPNLNFLPDTSSIPSEIKDQFEKIPFQWKEEFVDFSPDLDYQKFKPGR